MKISVVTAVYNRRETIAQTMRSVQAQSYSNIEHIVQDGGSTDGTLEVIQALRDEKTSVVSGPDAGLYDGINLGIRRARGDVIGLMHSDDYFSADNILSEVANAFTDPAIDGVYGDLEYVSGREDGSVVRYWRAGPFRSARLGRGWMPPHPTLYLRREVFDRFGLYDTSYRIAADYDAMLRFIGTGKIRLHYIPQVMVRMRVGGASNRTFSQILQKSREDYRALRENKIGGGGALLLKNASKITQYLRRNSK